MVTVPPRVEDIQELIRRVEAERTSEAKREILAVLRAQLAEARREVTSSREE